ncbi:hypothetical protein AB6A40_004376 [Gnathostoma spinigerum]|uniref:C2H2-type domain-containing protein n=1 Tax=Gnathostoma spinigerum TaxID=75299 RepID=A0ABD6EEH1_9BILA
MVKNKKRTKKVMCFAKAIRSIVADESNDQKQCTSQLVHPAFRRYIRCQKHGGLPSRLKSCVAAQIRNRILRYRPLPRVAPFRCPKCYFSSKSLHKVRQHICSKKSAGSFEFRRDQKVTLTSFRSRNKDCLGVLERIPNPQCICVSPLNFLTDEASCSNNRVPALKDLAYNALDVFSHEDDEFPTEFIFEDSDVRTMESSYKVNCSKIGYYCLHCRQLFREYRKYDSHLEDGTCPDSSNPNPIPVQMTNDSHIPCEYTAERRKSICSIQMNPNMKCTLCNIESGKFATLGEFHEHLFSCAESKVRERSSLVGQEISMLYNENH